ncbi:MAG TPA: NAD(+) diphosphatase [Longimicrobiaceae bacterium]|nr:NAD(+) diphosphatase [Longimicrobiaceae bacterium]
MPRHNVFPAGGVDRAMERRGDAAWVADCLRSPAARFLPVWQMRHLVAGGEAPRAVRLPANALGGPDALAEPVLLGLEGETPLFAVEVTDEALAEELSRHGEFHGLREVGSLLDRRDAGLLAQARALTHWHRHHRHCASCGAPTRPARGGALRVCTRPDCGVEHFPRTDPAVIVLVSEGDACLLGRQPTWPAGRYSTLAGFVEPGESLEDAVAREVMEEAGAALRDVRYHSSQPWPFPASLMVGFTATARSRALRVDHDELDDARWFTREEIHAGLADGSFLLPSESSIAFALVDGWLRAG